MVHYRVEADVALHARHQDVSIRLRQTGLNSVSRLVDKIDKVNRFDSLKIVDETYLKQYCSLMELAEIKSSENGLIPLAKEISLLKFKTFDFMVEKRTPDDITISSTSDLATHILYPRGIGRSKPEVLIDRLSRYLDTIPDEFRRL